VKALASSRVALSVYPWCERANRDREREYRHCGSVTLSSCGPAGSEVQDHRGL